MDINHSIKEMGKRKKILDKYVNVDWSVFKGKKVLDIGPAYGIWSMRAIDRGAKSVTAIDVDDYWVKAFPQVTKHLGYNIPITQKNVLDLKVKSAYDVVFFLAVWHHIIDWPKALDNVFNAVKDGGTLFLEGPVGETTVDKKHKTFSGGKKEQHAFYWIPSQKDLFAEINKRGGKVVKYNYNSGNTRIYLQVIK
jgi:2-polyprenyl-3-methyl-5-hydroxy-6-metoxy-1,4-benzoquinol methylase